LKKIQPKPGIFEYFLDSQENKPQLTPKNQLRKEVVLRCLLLC